MEFGRGVELSGDRIQQNLPSEPAISAKGNDLCNLATLPGTQVFQKANTKPSVPFRGVGTIIAKLIY